MYYSVKLIPYRLKADPSVKELEDYAKAWLRKKYQYVIKLSFCKNYHLRCDAGKEGLQNYIEVISDNYSLDISSLICAGVPDFIAFNGYFPEKPKNSYRFFEIKRNGDKLGKKQIEWIKTYKIGKKYNFSLLRIECNVIQ